MSRPPNRLAQETSPYLRQHAHNPVDWRPWGAEALALAKAEQKPIFLSVGYAACHWCHVMERESFEDEAVAELLNARFINIKVDREERPDVDQLYMNAVVALTRHGGWPMSVFLTPDQRPFYAGTYFPPDDRHGLPSFRRVLQGVLAAWEERRDDVLQSATHIASHLADAAEIEASDTPLNLDLLRGAEAQLDRAFDPHHGGFGQAPKFPHPLEIKLLLRIWRRFGSANALQMAEQTLTKMAAGGIYDHLGGGFARYSTDSRWLVPHFEKMLYDNALLGQAYLEGYLATGAPHFRTVVEETLAWTLRELTSPAGAFYSTLDADSEGVEGKFYVWSAAEVEAVLGQKEAELFGAVFDVTPAGNWEGHNILHRPKSNAQDAKLLKLEEDELRRRLDAARAKLFAARAPRVRPGLDDKILAGWNGLMISTFAQAAQVLSPEYAEPARRAMDFVLTRMRTPDGRLLRVAGSGLPAKLPGFLEDYAFILNALVDLYETTFEVRWVEEASTLAERLLDLFWDPEAGGFFFVAKDGEQLLLREKEPHDNAVPSGNSMAALALLRLAKLMDRKAWAEKAERTLALYAGLMAATPMAFGQMLAAVDFLLGPTREWVIVAGSDEQEEAEMLKALRAEFCPNRVVMKGDAAAARLLPQLAGKVSRSGKTTVYLCENQTCEAPMAGAAELRERLERE